MALMGSSLRRMLVPVHISKLQRVKTLIVDSIPTRPKTKEGRGGQINSKPKASTTNATDQEVAFRTDTLDVGNNADKISITNVDAAVTVKTAENN
ncbi:Uncharacterized protein TCM_031957 isoform 1 [Theobroma cacao]|uniref:Uncharacterized protein isoform 1 n=1 Tax=Theobroma cacao TaxID=3641 RepID=A0A061FFY8_THECC|nr:Uncharacterized protein TCM_031957 isoform 1 [Theobroma cacao]